MITIINYGLGNVNSVANVLNYLGAEYQVTSEPNVLYNAEKLILPGVGAFDNGMELLKEKNLINALNQAVNIKKTPILGICLGMQLMCKYSEEGTASGLGWVDAVVKKIKIPNDSGLKVPHMGWSSLKIEKENILINPSDDEQRFYFVHSYHVVCNNSSDILASTHFGSNIVASFSHDNIFGVQFHPEKSHRFGFSLFKKFIKL
jgi:glutamine amidotransferase